MERVENMNTFMVGFAREDVTPYYGAHINGYYHDRFCDGVLDRLEVNALAVSDGESTAVLLALDSMSIKKTVIDPVRQEIAKATGLPLEAVYVHTTHTHLAPTFEKDYAAFMTHRLADCAVNAIADLKPAVLSGGRSQARNIAFVRRYRMKDGSIQTNPGVNNPEIVEPIGTPDETVQVIRIQREGADEIAVINFQCHPDTIGGSKVSADYPGFTRRCFEAAMPGTRCIFFNGTQGDTNHVNVHPAPGYLNGLDVKTFDDVSRGYEHSRYMGNVVAAAALQIYRKMPPLATGKVRFGQLAVRVEAQKAKSPEELAEARRINALHQAGRDSELPYQGMMLTTVVAEACRMLDLENAPDFTNLYLSAVAFGDVAFIGLPGEPFTDVGRYIKANAPFKFALPTCLTNGSEGYYPVRSAYEEGGYEARSSEYCPGVAEKLAEGSVELLKTLK